MEKITTIKLEDEGQDFLELKISKDGVISGYSLMFSGGKLSLLGIGTLDGKIYLTFNELKKGKFQQKIKNLYIYLKNTGEKDPLPWKAMTLNYKIILNTSSL